MTVDPRDEGGDPACWLHLFDDDADEGAGDAEGPAGDADAAPPPAKARPVRWRARGTGPPEQPDDA